MKIIQTNELTEEQNRQIRELEEISLKPDALENHLFLSTEINYDRTIPVFCLYYEEDCLLGFLTFFIPSHEEAEISAVVHPDYRRQGIFTKMDSVAREVIKSNGIGRILYSVETKSTGAVKVLEHWKISQILRSEYRMKKTGIQNTEISADFSVKRADADNIDDYMRIDNKAFGEEENSEFAKTVMNSDTRIGYLLYYKGEPIGTFAIGLEQMDQPFIYGVAIDEKKRGQGFGTPLMEYACKICAGYGNTLWLDVDSENPVAYHLYQKMKFETVFQVDYYVR